jgi:hypothetical protein
MVTAKITAEIFFSIGPRLERHVRDKWSSLFARDIIDLYNIDPRTLGARSRRRSPLGWRCWKMTTWSWRSESQQIQISFWLPLSSTDLQIW